MLASSMNNEFEGVWKEKILHLFAELIWKLLGGSEENYGSSESR
jgi:hypothetical protein